MQSEISTRFQALADRPESQRGLAEGALILAAEARPEIDIDRALEAVAELVERVQEVVGWPATEADYRKAAHLIPDALVRSLMAVGTSHECRDKVAEYIEAGVTCPILYPMMDDIKPVVDAFADWEP